MKPIYRLIAALLFMGVMSFPAVLFATEDYAFDTGKACAFCHEESTGGPLKTTGLAYIRNGYRYPVPERILNRVEDLQTPFHRTIRFLVGYVHLVAAVIFFGAIFYIHIFIRPSRLTGGIPRPERILGVSCMVTLALTGLYLTWFRMDRWGQLVDNTFGLMLALKIILFLLMVTLGVVAITVVNSGMRKSTLAMRGTSGTGPMTSDSLRLFDGTEGHPAYIVYQGKVYDVSESDKWKEGTHFGRHTAGMDLSGALAGAPHGPEVFENVKTVGEISSTPVSAPRTSPQKVFMVFAYANLAIVFLILACISIWRWGFPVRLMPGGDAGAAAVQADCMGCHRSETPGIASDWERSVHAKVGVTCSKCHRADREGRFVSTEHLGYSDTKVSAVVSPKTCGGCHPDETSQYGKSKHAHTLEIMWKVDKWLNDGMNNDIEQATGCFACHGTVVDLVEGTPKPGTWPNVGVGRINPDGSLGSCSSCHTRHRFSVVEARKPEACDQCHLGPDHPHIEIYNESKHGTIYHSEGDSWNWAPDDGKWKAGRDYRAPTCSTCHMSAAGDVPVTHDTTERLAWETQAPLTVRPEAFAPFPADVTWQGEREKMKRVCRECHSQSWTDDHFRNLDAAVENYNENYYMPVKKIIDSLYESKLLSRDRYFDEDLEWEFYELWHHEGRRARMGAAMMAPDYAWWHGFYELKHRYIHFLRAAEELKKKGKGYIHKNFPGKMKN